MAKFDCRGVDKTLMSASLVLETAKLFSEHRIPAKAFAESMLEEFGCLNQDLIAKMAQELIADFPTFSDFAAVFFTEISLQLKQVIASRNEKAFYQTEELKGRITSLQAVLKSKEEDLAAMNRLIEE